MALRQSGQNCCGSNYSRVAKTTPMALCNYSRAVKTDVALITAEWKNCCSINYSRVLKTAEHFIVVAKNSMVIITAGWSKLLSTPAGWPKFL